MRAALLAAALMLCASAQAQVYKCKEGDKFVFSDVPCADGTKVSTKPAAGSGDEMERYKASIDLQRMKSQLRQTDVERSNARRRATAVDERKVMTGMTADEVTASWGAPSRINRGLYAGKVQEQWIYDRKNGYMQYVYLENGIVTTAQ